jgi:protein arginine kinase activator
MVCDECKKNEATIHFTQIFNNKVTKFHLCQECAKEKGIMFPSLDEALFEGPHLALASLLAGLSDIGVPYALEKPKAARKCPNCKATYDDFRESGRLGCSECYRTFKNELWPLLRRLHGSVQHTGKVPFQRAGVGEKVNEIMELRRELQKAIDKEEYERAAVIRDKIKELEKKK